VGRLDFELPDVERFPALKLARAAAQAGGTAPAVLNAANEVAVGAFLAGQLAFTGITALIDRVMQMHTVAVAGTLAEVLAADAWARAVAETQLLGQIVAGNQV
jgi:1-deoxy-D-xylulose-5-phosphate reductoisomerase